MSRRTRERVRLAETGQDLLGEMTVALYAALGEAGFEIPFPQRELQFRAT